MFFSPFEGFGCAYTVSETFNWEVDPRITFDDGDVDQTNVPGDTVSVAISAEDDATTTPTVSYTASGLSGGLSIDSTTGIISGTITATVSSTPDSVTVTVSDGTASASETFNWTLTPVILPGLANQANVGEATVSLALSDDVAGGYTVSYSETGLPTGLSINSSTGLITGTLSSGDTGNNYLVTVAATAGTVTSTENFAWAVGTVVVTEPADQTNFEGDTVSLAVSAQALSGTLTYSAVGLPDGLSINSSTGVISGTIAPGAAEDGPFTPTVVASNGTQADSQMFNWNVNPLVNVTSIDDQSAVEGDSVSLQETASELGATMTFSATGLPTGLSINSSTGLISGTVAAGDSADGPYEVDVTASDGTYYSDVYYNLSITNGSTTPPTLTNPGMQVNTVDDSVNVTVSASDTDGGTLSFEADGLPDGLSIDPDSGIISGYVAADAVSSTPYVVAVTVTDNSSGTTPTQTFSWLVNDSTIAITAPTISATEDTDTTVTLAFTDSDPNWTTDDFTASIKWGDGTTDDNVSGNAIVSGSNGTFTVIDDHAYASSGTYSPVMSISDGFETVSATGTATVAVAPLELTGNFGQGGVNGTVGGEWAFFSDADASSDSSDYTATIYWGDGDSSAGTISGSGGEYVVSGDHSYMTNGSYNVTVAVSNSTDGTSGTVTGTAMSGNVVVGEESTMTLAWFTSSDLNSNSSQFTASVNWGDGDTGTGTVMGGGGAGTYVVVGTHDYLVDSLDQPGHAYTVSVTVSGPQGEVAETTVTSQTKDVYVVRPAITVYGNDIVAQQSVGFSGVEAASFIDPDISDSASEFAATIYWGDGTSSTGTVTGANGLFQVLGGHTYTDSTNDSIEVMIAQEWEQMKNANGTEAAKKKERVPLKAPTLTVQSVGPTLNPKADAVVLGENGAFAWPVKFTISPALTPPAKSGFFIQVVTYSWDITKASGGQKWVSPSGPYPAIAKKLPVANSFGVATGNTTYIEAFPIDAKLGNTFVATFPANLNVDGMDFVKAKYPPNTEFSDLYGTASPTRSNLTDKTSGIPTNGTLTISGTVFFIMGSMSQAALFKMLQQSSIGFEISTNPENHLALGLPTVDTSKKSVIQAQAQLNKLIDGSKGQLVKSNPVEHSITVEWKAIERFEPETDTTFYFAGPTKLKSRAPNN